ncbi:SusC/RagA family TonB-linked outer membrane protein [Spirosoma endbachense]|uniref:SusC/RagA family TonB-linked outer membrane protein n=1 Tax=Spirosoma endbachense TaxID=2666025 RepID=A0A6P1VWC1_9BACT|nr:TonB-dependent receptor [Spirosoma endbachense]QHV97055.1 SusC/RagA family TonB-linked outer membrane protein [Spirosoma endbachense]
MRNILLNRNARWLVPLLVAPLLILLANSSIAGQTDTRVTGKVTDKATNTGLPGVTVQVKGTNTGTVTDATGTYSIQVTENATLVFSSIGFVKSEVSVGGRAEINVTLEEDTKALDEVVVVGYGTQRKSDVTGATVTIKGDELVKQPVLTATQALQGKAAGVQIISSGQPGSSPVVRIRGTGSAIGGTAALFVVDGVLTDDITNINTADIVNVDVLKDASATAIYGSRGANGVIIITTKRGTAGKMTVNYSGNAGFRMPSYLVPMANAAEYANYASVASGNLVSPGSTSTDWYKQILRNGFQQNHGLSINGGTDKSTYFVSAGYYTDQGLVIDNVYKRFSIRANNDFTFNKHVKAGLSASYANGDNQIANLSSAYNNAYRAAPIIQSKENGKYGNTSVYQNVGNPLLDIEKNNNHAQDNRLLGSAYLEIKPIEWLTFRSNLGGDWVNLNSREYNYQFNNDTTTFINPGGNQRNPNSNLKFINTRTFHWTWDNLVTFNKKFDKHALTVLVGTTAEKYTLTSFTAYRKDVPAAQNLWYINTGDANTSTNDGAGDQYNRNSYIGRLNYSFNDKYLFTATIRADGSSRFPAQNRWGYFPSVGAGWMISNEDFMANQHIFDMLKLRASWGKVGNDRIPTDAYTVTVTPNLAYPFGGGIATPGSAITQIKDPNVKWETTEEADLGIEFTALSGRLTGELNYYNKKSRDLLINVKVPSVTGDADGVVLTNAASIQNQGVELTLNWRGKITNDLSYRIGGNATLNQNKVIGLNGGQPILDGAIGGNQQYTTRTDNGQPVGSFYVLQVLGVFQNDADIGNYKNATGQVIQPSANPGDFKYQDTNGDGKIDDNDRVFAGSYQPKAYFGLNLGLTYKGFDLSADFYGNVGNQIYNGKRAFRQSALDNVERSMAYNRWTPSSGTQTNPAANSGNLPASTYFIESGNFARINNLTLGYQLPGTLLQKVGITTARVFVTGQNLFTIKKYSGFTAELPGFNTTSNAGIVTTGSPTTQGIELNAYPTASTVAFGLNVGF